MCTTPQNLFVPRAGIDTDSGHRSVDELAADLAAAMDRLLGEDAKAVELLGAIVSDDVLRRLEAAPSAGDVAVPSRTVKHPAFPDATVRTPAVVAVDVADESAYGQECFGPVAFLVRTGSTDESIEALRSTVDRRGALTAAVYSTDPAVLARCRAAALDAGVALSENLTGGVYVNQSAAFSDFHATGANPAANASYTDGAFVAGRFRVVQSRRHLPAPAAQAPAGS
jgi:phenylacetic acid degradation protein paaN